MAPTVLVNRRGIAWPAGIIFPHISLINIKSTTISPEDLSCSIILRVFGNDGILTYQSTICMATDIAVSLCKAVDKNFFRPDSSTLRIGRASITGRHLRLLKQTRSENMHFILRKRHFPVRFSTTDYISTQATDVTYTLTVVKSDTFGNGSGCKRAAKVSP